MINVIQINMFKNTFSIPHIFEKIFFILLRKNIVLNNQLVVSRRKDKVKNCLQTIAYMLEMY